MKETFGKRNWCLLIFFALIGQIAWSVENMFFNLFVFEEVSPNLDIVTLMVQLSGIMATIATLIAGTISDKTGNRKSFICWGYIIWGVTVALFGSLSPDRMGKLFSLPSAKAVTFCLVAVVVGDCVMTLFGSTANDACFNAWVTDNTMPSFRGKVESVLSVLPLIAMLIVAGGFGILQAILGYFGLFLSLGIVISLCGVIGLFTLQDSPSLEKNGKFQDIFYGFKPSVIKSNAPFYLTLCVIGIYSIACQIFMPYLIIYMKTYLAFTVVEYSIVFGAAIIFGAIANVIFGKYADKLDKVKIMYIAAAILSIGLLGMYFVKGIDKLPLLIFFGIAGFVMISGYILFSALSNAVVRDYTPKENAGKLQGVRMVFSVLLPMIFGPMLGNAINKARNIPLENAGADAMTTQYVPAPEIFLAGAICAALVFIILPILSRAIQQFQTNKNQVSKEENYDAA
jgi:MFS family permease